MRSKHKNQYKVKTPDHINLTDSEFKTILHLAKLQLGVSNKEVSLKKFN